MPRSMHDETRLRTFAAGLALRGAIGVAAGIAVALAVWQLDRLLRIGIPVDSSMAQALLGACLGGVLTIAVFALWMRTVVVGLASGQVSSRILVAYLDDRFQRRVLGVMVSMFSYLASVMVLLPADAEAIPLLSASVGFAAVIAALIGVLLAMRNAVSSLSMPSVVRTLADQVLDLLAEEPWPNDALPVPAGRPTGTVIRSRTLGWIQGIDFDGLLDALPAGATLELGLDVGDFVAEGERVATLSVDVDEDTQARLRAAFTVTRTRSTRLDLAYAVQQLVDIAEHAMAPHSSDTSTAYEALVHLRGVLHVLIRRGTATGCRRGEDDRAVVSGAAWSPADHLTAVFERLHTAVPDASMCRQVQATVEALQGTADEVGDDDAWATLDRLREELSAGGSTTGAVRPGRRAGS
ncbi:DUF2254 family protein [Egicoccus sp. AB-alg6-2]|uniref:DUF2254 family protein n=1 Tax=Egicoccus sp. AB-alg6-2 TaxID=3242692 RepID=UPI00359D8995